jgi:hypothetical protein
MGAHTRRLDEGRAQDLVPGHEAIERLPDSADIDRAVEQYGTLDRS